MRKLLMGVAGPCWLVVLATSAASAQLMSTCAPDSPERRGEIGCSVLESKILPEGLAEPVFWHIDRFDSLKQARAAVTPASIAFDAGGVSWLMTIERETTEHHGGEAAEGGNPRTSRRYADESRGHWSRPPPCPGRHRS